MIQKLEHEVGSVMILTLMLNIPLIYSLSFHQVNPYKIKELLQLEFHPNFTKFFK